MSSKLALQLAPATTRPPNGYTLWEGPSREDGVPIAVVVTGLVKPSQNPKTGPMAQVWVLLRDIPPAVAVKTGQDVSVCNHCSFRPTLRRALQGPTSCYVRQDAAVNQVWKSYRAGRYPKVQKSRLGKLLRGRRLRGGAYGNLGNAPLWVTLLLAQSGRHTQYEHDWVHCDPELARYAMASVGTLAEKAHANRLGWRTFRVKRPEEPPLPDERECPAQERFRQQGRWVTCYDCGACHGTGGVPGKVNIVIDDHGPGSLLLQQKINRGSRR